jgi:hypothetical protein
MANRPAGRPVIDSSRWLVVVVVVAVLLSLASPALAQDGAAYGARPGPGDGDRSSGTFNLSVGTGGSVSDGIEILNFTDHPATFDVYAADVVPASAGGLAPAARGAERTAPAAWVVVDQPTVEVAPRSSRIVAFTITVPVGAPVGDSTAALLVESRESADSGAIAAVTRVGLWLKVKVTRFQGEVKGDEGTPWAWPWIVTGLLGLAFLAWLAYVTRDRRRRWLQDRQEERALLREFRSRRRRD